MPEPKTILIAYNTAGVREIVRRFLTDVTEEARAFRDDYLPIFLEAGSGQEALRILEQEIVDLAVFQMGLPENGMELVLDAMESLENRNQIKVIIFPPKVTYCSMLTLQGNWKIDGYLAVPFNSLELVRLVRQVFGEPMVG
jgi:response regulator RpfG family c-di-GMP phosphodiesterase